jgi:DNA-binding transcriptional ArsR family regulator
MSDSVSTVEFLSALASDKRLLILKWLLSPTDHFPPQRDGDLVTDGVCVGFIADKIGLKQPTVTSHMKVLSAAGLVSSKQIKNWVFYKANRDVLRIALAKVADDLCF